MKSLLCTVGAALLVLALAVTPAAHASVVIAGTRVVFPAATGEVTIRLTNDGNQPALIEAWVDDGDPNSTPDTAKVPFLVTPPLVRMNAGKGQSLRIVYTGQQLPTDRESLFWLNVLEIPPKPASKTGEEQNTLQFAIRSRLKLFFRPPGLAEDPSTAAQQVAWSVVPDGKGLALQASNASPYYLTFSKVSLTVGGIAHAAGTGMVAPKSSLRLPLADLHRAAPGAQVDYTVINDFGAGAAYKGTASP